MPELSALIARCRAGDELAWEQFVRALRGRVFGLACAYVGRRDDALDLAQEIFVRLFENRRRWPAADEFLPWMFQVARNRAIDFLRRQKVRSPDGTISPDDLPALADRGASPEAQAISGSRRERLRAALERVTAANREALVLRYMEELSVQQAAAVLGVAPGTVKSRANRGRAELAARLLELRTGRREP